MALEITVDEAAAEAVEFALNELDSLGTEINILGRKTTEKINVIGYFNELLSDGIVAGQINEALRIYGFPNEAVSGFEWREVLDEDWLAEWKKHWKPTETGRFIIAPPWETVENPNKIVIRIEPNMAFGTGTHETTRLCLRAIEAHYRPEMSFFDVGTGTGILAIAVKKLATEGTGDTEKKFNKDGQDQQDSGLSNQNLLSESSVPSVAKICGCDTDADSIRIARENAALNEADGIEFDVGSISGKTPPFDFVCANLTADVIVPLLPLLIEKTRKILILSGILAEQKDLVSNELRSSGITDFTATADGEWISIECKMDNG